MKRILICLEKLDIGGVETAVITQAREYKRRKYDVVILASDGCYTSILKEEGFKVINYNFTLSNNIYIPNELEKIIEENKIDEIHIHQYPCILHILSIALLKKIPYVIYIHSSIKGTYEWYIKTYSIYNYLFPICFKNASKIVVIRENEKYINSKKFNIDNLNKYYYQKNSFDIKSFDKINNNKTSKNKILIIGRICKEKEKMIKSAIEFALELKKNNSSTTITVVGDGEILESFKQQYKSDINFYGKTTDVFKIMNEHSIVIAADRCIVEAMLLKKIAILSNYNGDLELITKDNIISLSNDNFSGTKMTNNKDLLNVILTISKNKINQIINENKKYIDENYDIRKNILDEKLTKPNIIDIADFIYCIEFFSKQNLSEQNNSKKLYEENQKLHERIIRLNHELRLSLTYRIKNKIKNMRCKNGL